MNHCRERTTDANSSRQRSFTSHDRHLPCLFQIPIEYPTGKIIMIFQQGDHENSLKRFCSKIHWTRTYATKSLTTTATAILYHQLIIEHRASMGHSRPQIQCALDSNLYTTCTYHSQWSQRMHDTTLNSKRRTRPPALGGIPAATTTIHVYTSSRQSNGALEYDLTPPQITAHLLPPRYMSAFELRD